MAKMTNSGKFYIDNGKYYGHRFDPLLNRWQFCAVPHENLVHTVIELFDMQLGSMQTVMENDERELDALSQETLRVIPAETKQPSSCGDSCTCNN